MGFTIGLTGGIGSGKTAVSDLFAQLGTTIADADVASRQVVLPGTHALARITEYFGETVLNADGTLDRAALRHIVFADAGARRWLESVTVPAIMAELREILRTSRSPYAILMLSSGGGRSPLVHRSLVVDVPPDVQVARVTARDDNTREQVQAIMASQPSRGARLEYADDVIVNDGSLKQLEEKVTRLHYQYLSMASDHGRKS